MSRNKIEFKSTSLWYGEVIALNEVSFEFTPGIINGLVGSNGAGKSSSIKLAASLVKPTLGSVTIDGEDVWQNKNYLQRLGYCPEVDRLYNWLPGRKFLRWNGRFHGIYGSELENKVNRILDLVGMTHAADRPIKGYSRGMRQRVKVGQALLTGNQGSEYPEILLVDEPLSGTDPIGRKIMIDLFKELSDRHDTTIIVSSHVLHELERISDRIVVLEEGKLVAEGKVMEVRKALSKIPQRVKIVTDQPKMLAKGIADQVNGLTIGSDSVVAQVANRQGFAKILVDVSTKLNIDIYEMDPLDEDLTSVFNLIKQRNLTDE